MISFRSARRAADAGPSGELPVKGLVRHPCCQTDMAPAVAGSTRRGDCLRQPRPSEGGSLGCRSHLSEGGFCYLPRSVVGGRTDRNGAVEQPEGLSHGVGWPSCASARPSLRLGSAQAGGCYPATGRSRRGRTSRNDRPSGRGCASRLPGGGGGAPNRRSRLARVSMSISSGTAVGISSSVGDHYCPSSGP